MHVIHALYWSPQYRKDVETLGRVRRTATKMIGGLKAKIYEEPVTAFL